MGKRILHLLHWFHWAYEKVEAAVHVLTAFMALLALVLARLEEPAHLAELLVAGIVVLNVVCAALLILARRLTVQLPSTLRRRDVTQLARFLFRRMSKLATGTTPPACSEADLTAVTRFCHELFENMGLPLSYEQREVLYRRWWRGNDTSILPIRPHPGGEVVGACIALPIRRKAAVDLVLGRRDVDSFDETDVVGRGGPADCVLFDMWAMTPESRERYRWTSIKGMLRYLRQVINASGAYAILVQPDTDDKKAFIEKAGFQRVCRTAKGGELYAINFLWSAWRMDGAAA